VFLSPLPLLESLMTTYAVHLRPYRLIGKRVVDVLLNELLGVAAEALRA